MSAPTTAPISAARRRPSRLRRAGIQLLATLVVLGGVEGALQLLGYGPPAQAEDPYVGFSNALPLYVEQNTLPESPGAAAGQMVTAPYKRNHFNVQSFAAEKEAGTVRILSLGGSSTYGRPYADPTSFSGWLRAWLPEAAPHRAWEVLNAGGISYASYRVALVLEEMLQYDPDIVIIYSGHNEFLEERTYAGLASTPPWLLSVGSWARRSALFQALRSLLGAQASGPTVPAAETLPGEVQTLLDQSLGPDAYTRDDRLRGRVLQQYRAKLVAMVRRARAAGADVVLVAPASQLLDCRPFKSERSQRDSGEPGAPLPATNGEQDLQALRAAIRSDPRFADHWYDLGLALLASGDTAGARLALERARDEDIVPLRALSEVRAIVREVASQEGAHFLDAVAVMDTAAQELSGRPIPGADLFLDHVHMTVEGYRRLSAALLDTLAEADLVQLSSVWTPEREAAVNRTVEARLSTEDHVRALSRLASVLDWAGKTSEAEALTDRALGLAGGRDAMSSWLKGNFHFERGELSQGIDAYEEAVRIDPDFGEAHFNLSAALRQAGRREQALPHAKRAAQLTPDDAAVLYGYGVLLDELGRADDARAVWLRARASDGTHGPTLNALGLAALRSQAAPTAEQFFREAVAAQPEDARSHFNLALLLLGTNRSTEAEQSLRAALNADPDYQPARDRLDDLLRLSSAGN